jgi:hypothetical protein
MYSEDSVKIVLAGGQARPACKNRCLRSHANSDSLRMGSISRGRQQPRCRGIAQSADEYRSCERAA